MHVNCCLACGTPETHCTVFSRHILRDGRKSGAFLCTKCEAWRRMGENISKDVSVTIPSKSSPGNRTWEKDDIY